MGSGWQPIYEMENKNMFQNVPNHQPEYSL